MRREIIPSSCSQKVHKTILPPPPHSTNWQIKILEIQRFANLKSNWFANSNWTRPKV